MEDNPWRYIGVDWDSGAWVTVGYPDTGRAEPAVFDTIEDLWREYGTTAERIVVDVPIGLCESHDAADGCVETDGELSRRCDDLARNVLGPRSSSVFTAPCRDAARAAANGAEYSDVNETNRNRTGKGLMQQAANIAPGIVERRAPSRPGQLDHTRRGTSRSLFSSVRGRCPPVQQEDGTRDGRTTQCVRTHHRVRTRNVAPPRRDAR